ncbi:hypothetical protein ACFL1W_01460 [Candidatus Margulisiibacteriota bacterium]
MMIAIGGASWSVPQMMNIQGRLTDKISDGPITGPQNIGFYLWDSPSGGSLLGWNETLSGVECDENGIFNAILGSTTPIPDSAFEGDVAYMEIRVQKDGIWSQIFERQRMVAVPYAITARNVRDGVVANAQSVHLAATAPDDMVADAGTMYYNGDTNRLQYSDGGQWISLDPPYTAKPIQMISLYDRDGSSNVMDYTQPGTTVGIFTPTTDCILVGVSGNLYKPATQPVGYAWYQFKLVQGPRDKVYFTVHEENASSTTSPYVLSRKQTFNYSFPFPIKVAAGEAVQLTCVDRSVAGRLNDFALYYIELPLTTEE